MGDNNNALIGAAIGLGLLAYYYSRTERSKRLYQANVASEPPAEQMRENSKFAFVDPRFRFADRSVWKINEPGFARQGQFGLERRDYIDPVSGSRIPTYTDAWVNV